ncbi:alpha/beta hydrolase [Synechococcus sp. SynAce01]|nr:alpha/beta hydrolase [Synechococcus sp. SynAce01]
MDWGEHAVWRWQGMACHWRQLGNPGHPPLLLIHGFGCGSGHWRRTAGPLAAAGWCVYGLDLIGFGDSAQPARRLDNRLWARQVQAFLEEVVQAPAVLVGHSLGSLVALSCAVFFPGWVRAVAAATLPDPTLLVAVPRRRPPWRRRLQRLVVILLCRLLPLELLVPLIARTPLLDLGIQSAYATAVIGDSELRQLIAAPARRPTASWALRGMSIGMALRPRQATAAALLARMQQPLLVLWGEADRLVPIEVSRQLVRYKSDLELTLLEGVGHCPHDEAPAEFSQQLHPWLSRLKAAT